MSASPTPSSPNAAAPGPTPTGYQRSQGGTSFKWQPPTPEHLSKLLPQYEIEALVGRGGMGAVYKGKQKALDRTVAIKILPPEVDDEDASYTERFKNEAKIMAKLEHPAIVPVYDFGETSEGQLYFVMSFINGTDVHQMVQSQGRLPAEHALAITAHVCDALRYAHEHGVIHRDIKPSNVLINMEGQVKVADFGLAKADDPSQSSGLTKTGLAMGTPDYVAPETLTLGMTVDGRADLYAVGVMLYQMLTGNVPRGAFKPASVMIPGLDPRFDAIVTKAMQTDRDDRYPTAADLRRDLDVILTTPQVQAGGQSSAAIPQQALPPKPQARGPAKPQQRPAQSAPPAQSPNHKSEIVNHKSKLLIGLGAAAAIAVGAFVMMGGKKDAKQSGPLTPLSATSRVSASPSAQGTARTTSSTPIQVREVPKAALAPLSKSTIADSTPSATAPSKPTATPPAPEAMNEAKQRSATVASGASQQPAQPQPTPTPSTSTPAAPPSGDGLKPGTTLFPPGQWVDMTEAFLQQNPSLMTRESEWIKLQSTPVKRPDFPNFKNVAAKLRLKRNPHGFELSFQTPNMANLILSISFGTNAIRMWRQNLAGGPSATFLTKPLADAKASVLDLETAVVGNRFLTRVNDQLLVHELDLSHRISPLNPGFFTNGDSEISDIKVINLDGLPEAEALRIIGVDEKGNDLRALAAKQEQQKAEQAKVVDAMAAIPELKTLHEQFVKLQAERVTAPFEADVAKLNASYLGGLDREIEKEKKAGHLDGVLVLEAEKKLIQGVTASSRQPNDPRRLEAVAPCPLPTEDDDTTPTVLKPLRKLYRDAFAKLETTRTANLKQLTDPLSIRLKQLESTLTQQNRIPDAKVVREYREGLGRAVAPEDTADQSPSTNPAAAALTAATTPQAPKYSEREVAEWFLGIGASLLIKTGANPIKLESGDKVPAGAIKILEITGTDRQPSWTFTDDDFARLRGLKDLRRLWFGTCDAVDGHGLSLMGKLPALTQLKLSFPRFVSSNLATVPDFPALKELQLPFLNSPKDFGKLPPLKSLISLTQTAGSSNVTRELLAAYAKRTKLESLNMSNCDLKDDNLAELAPLTHLERIEIGNTAITGTGLRHLAGLPALAYLSVGASSFEVRNLALIAELKKVRTLVLRAATFAKAPDECLSILASLKNQISDLSITYTTGVVTDEQIAAIRKAMPKTKVTVGK